MGRLAGFKYRQIIKKLKNWALSLTVKLRDLMKSGLTRQRISTPPFRTIQAICNMPEGTLKAIIKQAGVTSDQFLDV